MSPTDKSTTPSGFDKLRSKVLELVQWVQASRALRAFQRFKLSNGGTLCGGIAYTALFSIFGALAIGYTIFARIVGNNQELMDTLLRNIDGTIPGLLKIDGKEGLIAPKDLIMGSGFTLTTIIAGAVLLWAALKSMGAIRMSTRMMFDLPVKQSGMALAKVRELGGLAVLALSILVVSVAGIVVSAAGNWLIEEFNLPAFTSWGIPLGVLVASFTIDGLVFLLMVRLMTAVKLSQRDRLLSAIIAAVGFGVIRQGGSALVAGSATANPLLAPIAVTVTLLLWVNLAATIYLLACAFAANPSTASIAVQAGRAPSELESLQAKAPAEPVSAPANIRLFPVFAALAGYLLGRRAGKLKQRESQELLDA